jgi:hypothetical protein
VCRLKRFAPSEHVRAGSKTPTADYDAGRLIRSLSTKSPMRKSRTIVITANLTPRKCLGFKTPFQAILKELGKDVQIRFA